MDTLLRVAYNVLVDNKYKGYIKCSGKDGYVKIFYLVSGKSEEVGVKQDDLIRVSSSDQSGA